MSQAADVLMVLGGLGAVCVAASLGLVSYAGLSGVYRRLRQRRQDFQVLACVDRYRPRNATEVADLCGFDFADVCASLVRLKAHGDVGEVADGPRGAGWSKFVRL